MSLRVIGHFHSPDKLGTFNMTPIIDIVFLLIIFFLVVCQFIEAENFPLAVPDGCEFAQSEPPHRAQVTTVTIMKTAEGKSEFAVGSEKIPASEYANIVGELARLINVRLKDLSADNRVVTLRIDKDIYFAEAQYALAGIAASTATNIQLATLKDKRPNSEEFAFQSPR